MRMTHKVELIKSQTLPDFPSGSSINYCNRQLYLIGDDAHAVLILDEQYATIDSIQLFAHIEKRIPKKEKADLEASTFLIVDGVEYLLILGSGSKRLRKKIHLIPYEMSLLNIANSTSIDTDTFIDRVKSCGVDEINFEGITRVDGSLIISNRGNRANIANHIIITESEFWNNQAQAALRIVPLQVPSSSGNVPGVSELYYEESLDLLLIALSSEDTTNAYDDGAIGDSYIGWIKDFKGKMTTSALTMDGIICLPDIHFDFEREKIEGLCVEMIEDSSLIIHLISDNDLGESKLFKVKMQIP